MKKSKKVLGIGIALSSVVALPIVSASCNRSELETMKTTPQYTENKEKLNTLIKKAENKTKEISGNLKLVLYKNQLQSAIDSAKKELSQSVKSISYVGFVLAYDKLEKILNNVETFVNQIGDLSAVQKEYDDALNELKTMKDNLSHSPLYQSLIPAIETLINTTPNENDKEHYLLITSMIKAKIESLKLQVSQLDAENAAKENLEALKLEIENILNNNEMQNYKRFQNVKIKYQSLKNSLNNLPFLTIDQLNNKISDARQKINDYNDEKSTIENQINNNQRLINNKISEVNSLISTLRESKFDFIKNSLETTKANVSSTLNDEESKTVDKLVATLKSLETSLNIARSSKDAVNSNDSSVLRSVLSDVIAQAETLLTDLRNKHNSDFNQIISELNGAISIAKNYTNSNDPRQLNQQSNNLRVKISETSENFNKINNLLTQNKELLNKEIQNLNNFASTLTFNNQEITDLRNKVTRKINDYRNIYNNAGSTNSALNSAINNSKRDLNDFTAEKNTIYSKILTSVKKDVNAYMAELGGYLENWRTTYGNKTQEAQDLLSNVISELRANYVANQNDVDGLINAKTIAKMKYDQVVPVKDKNIKDYKDTYDWGLSKFKEYEKYAKDNFTYYDNFATQWNDLGYYKSLFINSYSVSTKATVSTLKHFINTSGAQLFQRMKDRVTEVNAEFEKQLFKLKWYRKWYHLWLNAVDSYVWLGFSSGDGYTKEKTIDAYNDMVKAYNKMKTRNAPMNYGDASTSYFYDQMRRFASSRIASGAEETRNAFNYGLSNLDYPNNPSYEWRGYWWQNQDM